MISSNLQSMVSQISRRTSVMMFAPLPNLAMDAALIPAVSLRSFLFISWIISNLVLTPVLFLDQTNVSPTATGVTITWKRKDGVASETALASGETVNKGALTVNANKLSESSSGMITYICYISYYDAETKNTINISSDITYTLVKNAANAKLCYVTSDT